jgi:hypothetical protein
LGEPADFRQALNRLRESETAFAILRSTKATAGKWVNAADQALTEWLAKARLALMLARGMRWSETWLDRWVHSSAHRPAESDCAAY